MTNPPPSVPQLPLSPEQLAGLQAATADFSTAQLAWLSGYFWGMTHQRPEKISVDTRAVQTPVITLLSASQTGNARRIAEQLRDDLQAEKWKVNLVNAGDYKFKQIAHESLLIVITSTQGEGEPPEEAVALHKFLFSKKAPTLKDTAFAVFGLGDSSYEWFCQAGKGLDSRLAELGAERLLARVDADVEYQEAARLWRGSIVTLLRERSHQTTLPEPSAATIGDHNQISTTPYTKDQPLTAQLAIRQKITGRNSTKDVRHLEIDLGDSGLRYQPGDALGVWFTNDPALVEELLGLLGLNGDEPVTHQEQILPLKEALTWHLELTVNTSQIVEKFARMSSSTQLSEKLADKGWLHHYAQTTPIVEMIRDAGVTLDSQQLAGLLRPLTPRLYSIASSQAEMETEVHITVGVVRYLTHGRERTGGASGWLADRLAEDVRIFIEHNDNFRLPASPQTPIIMIGPGTGVAPFRAFMQQRDSEGASGKNWLFFGNPHFTEDFLYQTEWQRYVKEGLLTRIDLAWSRDQSQKIYVQDKIRENGAELWRWIEQGAHIYVCGDASRMAKDVEQALLDIVADFGKMDDESADEFLSELRVERRYQRDVY